jgi:DNA-binding transcriptional ArsR family regulator
MSPLNEACAAALALLHDGPLTCSRLFIGARDKFGSFTSVTRSQIFRALPALADTGLVRLGDRGPRSSQQYVITKAGRKRFKDWLVSEPEPDGLRSLAILQASYACGLPKTQRTRLFERVVELYICELAAAQEIQRAAADPWDRALAAFGEARATAALTLIHSLRRDGTSATDRVDAYGHIDRP